MAFELRRELKTGVTAKKSDFIMRRGPSSARRRVSTVTRHLAPSLQGTSASTTPPRYTLPDHGRLTASQRAAYERDGYVVLRGLLTQDTLAPVMTRYWEYSRGERAPPELMQLVRDVNVADGTVAVASAERGVIKLNHFENDDLLMAQFARDPKLLDVVESFTGPDVMTINTMVVVKPPGLAESTRHPLHQDLLYFPQRPTDSIVCAWAAIERVDRENGCLAVLPGSHRAGTLHAHGYPKGDGWSDAGVKNNVGYWGILDERVWRDPGLVHLEMGPGDVVFFHPLLVHGSGVNRSADYRKAVSVHFAATAGEYIDVARLSPGTSYVQEQIEIGARLATKNSSPLDGGPGTVGEIVDGKFVVDETSTKSRQEQRRRRAAYAREIVDTWATLATDPEALDRATRLYNMYWRYKSRLVRGSMPAGDT